MTEQATLNTAVEEPITVAMAFAATDLLRYTDEELEKVGHHYAGVLKSKRAELLCQRNGHSVHPLSGLCLVCDTVIDRNKWDALSPPLA